ncbi:MAG: hypothetical protein SFU27_02450 [Thermonemataceae bacterium]|nr:hypothetical protein [Thermonemataceae bacterium]
MKKILFFIFLMSTLFQACKQKCRDVQSNQAPFRTYTVIPDVERDGKPTDVIAEADVFIIGGQVMIESLVENALKYEWRIEGDPTLKEGKKLAIYFQEPSVQAGDSLEIMSIVTRKPNPECIAGDDGVDTLTKKIHFIDKSQAPYLGRYLVHDELNEPNKYFEINISVKRTSFGDFLNAIEFLPADASLPLSFGEGLGAFTVGVGQYWSPSDITPFPTGLKHPYQTITTNRDYGLATLSKDGQNITIEHSFILLDTTTNPDSYQLTNNIRKCRFVGKRIN